MKQLSIMIKPASALCNMRCNYCFYADISNMRDVRSFGIMKEETSEKLLDNSFKDLNPGDSLTIAFQGGEPTMAGLDYFRHFVDYAKSEKSGVNLSWAFQTNGYIIDDEWCEFLKANNFLVGLSLDLAWHDENRFDPSGHGTAKRILEAKALFEKYDVQYNVLTVLTGSVARHPVKAWNFLIKHNISHVQFTPCLEDLDGSPAPYALTPERFASFYNGLFPLWLNEFKKGRYISVKLFDDVVNLLRGQISACGFTGYCMPQIVAEADGSVYPCDFFVLDNYKVGNIAETSLRELFENPKMAEFRAEKPPLPGQCAQCKYLRLCGCGCKRMRNSMYVNEKTGFCGYKAFLDNNIDALNHIAKN